MICWVIYNYKNKLKNKLSGTMAKQFIGDTYAEIDEDALEWAKSRDDILVIDVAETMMEDDD